MALDDRNIENFEFELPENVGFPENGNGRVAPRSFVPTGQYENPSESRGNLPISILNIDTQRLLLKLLAVIILIVVWPNIEFWKAFMGLSAVVIVTCSILVFKLKKYRYITNLSQENRGIQRRFVTKR